MQTPAPAAEAPTGRAFPQRAALALLLLALAGQAWRAADPRRNSKTYDEEGHLAYGLQALGGNTDRPDDSKMPVTALNALPLVAAQGLAEGPVRDALSNLRAARLVTTFFALLLAVLVYVWGRALYGKEAALFSTALLAFCPNLLAVASLATTDLYAVLAATAAFAALWWHRRRGGLLRAALAAAALAAGLVAKPSGFAVVPAALLALLAAAAPDLVREAAARDARGLLRRARSVALHGLLFLAVLVAVVNAAYLRRGTFTPLSDYPPSRSDWFQALRGTPLARVPLPLPIPFLQGLDLIRHVERWGGTFGGPRSRVYLLGEVRSGRGFKSYYLVALLFKATLPLQALVLSALVVRWRRRASFDFRGDEAFLLAPAAFFLLYLNLFFRVQVGIRYLLVIFPLLFLLAGSLARGFGSLRPWRKAALLGLLLWHAGSSLSYHPHYLAYFNELLLDRRLGWRILADSNLDWNQGEALLREWRRRHPGASVHPPGPRAGRIVVSVNALTGIILPEDRYRWLRENFTPTEHIAYCWLVFDVGAEDLQRLGLSPAP